MLLVAGFLLVCKTAIVSYVSSSKSLKIGFLTPTNKSILLIKFPLKSLQYFPLDEIQNQHKLNPWLKIAIWIGLDRLKMTGSGETIPETLVTMPKPVLYLNSLP